MTGDSSKQEEDLSPFCGTKKTVTPFTRCLAVCTTIDDSLMVLSCIPTMLYYNVRSNEDNNNNHNIHLLRLYTNQYDKKQQQTTTTRMTSSFLSHNNIQNPTDYSRRLWTETNSTWGKICIVLFYSFVWLQIAGGCWSLFDATAGWDCLWRKVQSSDLKLNIATVKSTNIWIVGFFLYANRNSCAPTNVFLVWLVYLAQWLFYKPAIYEFLGEACPVELQSLETEMTLSGLWITAALICSGMEAFVGIRNRGRDREARMPLLNTVVVEEDNNA